MMTLKVNGRDHQVDADPDTPLLYVLRDDLALSTTVSGPDARNAANIVLSGVRAVEGERSPIMPAFADSMTDAQLAVLLNYLRSRFSDQPAWAGVEKAVEDARRAQTVFLQTSPGPRNAPSEASQRDKP